MKRKGLFVGVPLALAFGVACTMGTPPSSEKLGHASSELFANGVPCSAPTQCASTFCVDGVCCNTACGGGQRDALTCSNVYGNVVGLVNGTCKTLVTGDACGALQTVDPCTWRGTFINGGGKCPNPPGGASACFPCATSGDCSGAFPVCINNACVACNGNFGSGATQACPAAAPTCTGGTCVQCTVADPSTCSGTTPVCDAPALTCASCNGDNGSGAPRPCPTSANRACLPSGACVPCSATNATACTGTTPACNTTVNQCAACDGDNGQGTPLACPTAASPYCFGTGACGKCTTNNDCIGHPGGSQCNPVSGACGTTCAGDGDCNTATQWCAAGVCTAKTENGQPLPSTAPIAGDCTVANGARVCVSGVCELGDDKCGLANNSPCGPPTTNAKCRSGICFAGDNKCGLPTGQTCAVAADCRSNVCPPTGKCGDCSTDTNCGAATSGRVCDDLAKTCGDGCRGTGGNGCPAGKICTSKTNAIGKCVQCTTDANCGTTTSGQVCNPTTSTCQAGCRGSGGNGCPTGSTCSSSDGTIGTCSGPDGGPVTDGGVDAGGDAGDLCRVDSQCGAVNSGRICDTRILRCVDGCRGSGGNGCPAGLLCSSISTLGGKCEPAPTPPAPPVDEATLEGGGLECGAVPGRTSTGGASLVGVAIAIAVGARRRRARRIRSALGVEAIERRNR